MDLKKYLQLDRKKIRFSARFAGVGVAILIIGAVGLYVSVPAVRSAVRQQMDGGKTASAAGGVRVSGYSCPMHPFITSAHPGSCSICGMTLVAQENAASQKDVACAVHAPGGVTLSPQQQIMANVAMTKIDLHEFSTETMAAGRVVWDERRLTKVSARIQGRIERLHVNFTGARIGAGQPLLDIYSPDLVAAQREYLLASDGAERSKESSPADSRSMMEELRDASRSRLKAWGVSDQQIRELDRKRQPRQVVTISSPVAGVVMERLVTAGQYVNEGTPLVSVGSLSNVWVIAELYENDIDRIAAGTSALVTTDAFPGKSFQGKVAFVDPVVNPETRTLKVRVDLDNRHGFLKPEMFVKVMLKGRKIKALAVPEGSVIFTGDRSMVWVESSPGRFVPRNVSVGRKGGGYYEVVSGLAGGESVAASGGFLIDSESQLKALQKGDRVER